MPHQLPDPEVTQQHLLMTMRAAGVAGALVAVIACAACLSSAAAFDDAAARKPNIIILLTDDQDALLGSTQFQPTLMAKVKDNGISFDHGFANTPVCCPSRSSLLTGRFTHNGGARNNSVQGDCCSDKWYTEREPDALAAHMNASGYFSLYAGKYLNHYGQTPPIPGSEDDDGKKRQDQHTPDGWTDWFGLHGNSRYYNYSMQRNDHGNPKMVEQHKDNYTVDYLTDVLSRRSVEFLNEAVQLRKTDGTPFFLWIGTPSAHASFTPAPQYEATAEGQKAPRPPSYNQVFQDKHVTVRSLSPMSDEQIDQSDRAYRQRLGTLRSVDDLIGSVYDVLEKAGMDEETWFFYTGDHGFHLGEFAMGFDKRQLYETDVRVPYYVRGPGIPAKARGSVRHEPISHVDLAPTIIDLAAGSVPSAWDGRSYKTLLEASPDDKPMWRKDTLLQYFGEGGAAESCGSNNETYVDGIAYADGSYIPAPCDGANNTYTCVRRVDLDATPPIDDKYCEFTCVDADHNPVDCPADWFAETYGEYYDLITDPWETKNTVKSLSADELGTLKARVAAMRNCQGQSGCQGLN